MEGVFRIQSNVVLNNYHTELTQHLIIDRFLTQQWKVMAE